MQFKQLKRIALAFKHAVFRDHANAFSKHWLQELPVGGASQKWHGPEYAGA